MAKSNYPAAQLGRLSGKDVSAAVGNVQSVADLAKLGKPKDTPELRERINQYFQLCASLGMRPGIEGLALALGVSRQAFWNWCTGRDCAESWSHTCNVAKQSISAFIEQAGMSGLISPVIQIWLQKNWFPESYKDVQSVQYDVGEKPQALSADQLPRLVNGVWYRHDEVPDELPRLSAD